MKKRYAVIIEEESTQTVEEVKNINEVLDVVIPYTNYFTPDEDSISLELIERRDYLELAKEIAYCYCNKEPQTSLGKRYCEILNDIKDSKTLEECYRIFPRLNELLKETNTQIEIFLNEREDDGCGWCGLEE